MYISDSEKLATPMGQFELWCGKLFVYRNDVVGWRYIKGLTC